MSAERERERERMRLSEEERQYNKQTKQSIAHSRQMSFGYCLLLQLPPKPTQRRKWEEVRETFRDAYLVTVSGGSPSPVVLTTTTTTLSFVISN